MTSFALFWVYIAISIFLYSGEKFTNTMQGYVRFLFEIGYFCRKVIVKIEFMHYDMHCNGRR